MAHYRQVGVIPAKRHTQFRTDQGGLHYEELMGEEGFSSDSSLLYHRGVPSAIVDSQVWELADLGTTANHPLKPRHLKLHSLFEDNAWKALDPVEDVLSRSVELVAHVVGPPLLGGALVFDGVGPVFRVPLRQRVDQLG